MEAVGDARLGVDDAEILELLVNTNVMKEQLLDAIRQGDKGITDIQRIL